MLRSQSKYYFTLTGLILLLISILCFFPGLDGEFIYDDVGAIKENKALNSLSSALVHHSLPNPTALSGRPLTSLSFAFQKIILPWNVFTLRSVNLLIHIVNALFLTLLIREYARYSSIAKDRSWKAWLLSLCGSAIWLVHPLTAQPVLYITQRTELLAGSFLLLSLYSSLRYYQVTQKALGEQPYRNTWMFVCLISCYAGMASKETAVVIPVLIALQHLLLNPRKFTHYCAQNSSLYIGLCCSWIWLYFLTTTRPETAVAGFGNGLRPIDYLMIQGGVITSYLSYVFFPHQLLFDYGHTQVSQTPISILSVLGLTLGLLASILLCFWKRSRLVGFAALAFYITLSPSSSIYPILTEVGALRRMYIPLAFIVIMIFNLIFCILRSGPSPRILVITATTSAAIIATLAWKLHARANDYSSNEKLWRSSLLVHPKNARAWGELACIYHSRGEDLEAFRCFSQAEVLGGDTHVWVDLGHYWAEKNQLARSSHCFTEAIALFPQNVTAHKGLVKSLYAQSLWSKAGMAAQRAIVEFPHEPYFQYMRAVLYLKNAEPSQAKKYILKLRKEYPQDARYEQLQELLQKYSKGERSGY